jgi:hypothetical protein
VKPSIATSRIGRSFRRTASTIAACALAASASTAATFTVTNTSDSGAGSLREAILGANGAAGLDTIDFAIPGAGVHTISPATALPPITSPVLLDGCGGGDYSGGRLNLR